MNMKRRTTLMLVTVFCLWTSLGAAQIYEWIDKNGVRHFTNLPPPPGAKIVNEQAAIPYDEAADQRRMQEDQEIQNQVLEQPESQTEQQAANQQQTPEVQAGAPGSSDTGQSVVEEPYVRNRDRVLRYGRPVPERGPIVTPLPGRTPLPERIP